MVRFVGAVVIFVVALMIAVPLITKLVNVLLVPVVVGTALYIAARWVNAYVNRW
jgi:hypothetical protein